MYRLLFVDDDSNIVKVNKLFFEPYGYIVDTALDMHSAMDLVNQNVYDCIVLDIVLPTSQNGYKLCKYIREKVDTPIIFLTSLTEKDFLYQGFSVGGDDYMTKPYDFKELKLRIDAHISRYRHNVKSEEILTFPPLTINLTHRQVLFNDESLNLTGVEFDILSLLCSNPGQPFMPDEIYQKVWNLPDLNSTHTVQTHIARLRRKLDKFSPNHHLIQTQWGKGYFFVPLNKASQN